MPPAPFLIFCSLALATRQSATAAAKTATSAGSAASTARQHLARALDMDDVDAGGIGQVDRAGDQRHLGAQLRPRRAAMAWPCLPEERLAM